ncbi:hypothetical protein [Muriicola sp.]|uniref:hypothetical protein n=1 Tax=Muriicola sp. TaxID=2020856 RepID=UPI003C71354C
MKYSLFLMVLSLLWSFPVWAQAKYEREFRIKQADFPQKALTLIKDEIQGVKRLRFYKEIDSTTISFEAKFKKDRLLYSIEFNTEGELQDIEILIQESDIPNDVLEAITAHLKQTYSNFKIRKIQQQYPLRKGEQLRGLLKEAFQNLLLPYVNYELIISCKAVSGRREFEYLFNAEGNFLSKRESLPANYDHILY